MKKISVPIILAVAFSASLLTLASSCKKCDKPTQCYDEQLYEQHKDQACTADCPGVMGCDGKTYCNECEANRQGISVQQ